MRKAIQGLSPEDVGLTTKASIVSNIDAWTEAKEIINDAYEYWYFEGPSAPYSFGAFILMNLAQQKIFVQHDKEYGEE